MKIECEENYKFNGGVIQQKSNEKIIGKTKKAESKEQFLRGIKDGIPIGLGYFAVAFTLGITAKNLGISPFQAGLMSFCMHASAGEFAFLTILSSNSGYVEMIIMQIVVNLRYLLMSCALSQKISKKTSMGHRMLLSYFITDEIFALDTGVKGDLNPFYNYGIIAVASPGWVIGTSLGVVFGNILPVSLSNALNIALYGMFLAVIIPASKVNKTILKVVIISMISSLVLSFLPYLKEMSSGFKIIVLTIVISSIAAIVHPVEEEKNES